VRDAHGMPMQLLGVIRDSTQSKRGEQALAERNTQLALAGIVGGIGTFAFDIATEKMQVSAGYAAIHGLPDGTRESTRAEWRSRVHADSGGSRRRRNSVNCSSALLWRHVAVGFNLRNTVDLP